MQVSRTAEERVTDLFRTRTPNSAKMFEKAKSVSPGGVMAGIKFFEPYPVFVSSAEGSHLVDVDGNNYVDYLMSYGALILGHGHESVKEAASNSLQLYGTTVTGTPTPLEVEFGGELLDIYHPGGLLRFTNSGLESTMLAVRLARAYTGKRMVAKFEGHYHGAVDDLLVSYSPTAFGWGDAREPVPVRDSSEVSQQDLENSLVLPFNDWDATEELLRKNATSLACVILEPFEEGVIPGEVSFMRSLSSLTGDLGIPLIFDEVKTGFRVRLGGASEFYSTVPELACLGKIIGGGLPVGAVVGSREIMGLLDPSHRHEKSVFHSGTFNGNVMTMALGKATINKLREDGNFGKICGHTDDLKRAISDSLATAGVQFQMIGEGAMFNFYLTNDSVRNYRDTQGSDLKTRKLLDLGLIGRGVYLKPATRFCLSLAHSSDDIRKTAEIFDESVRQILK